MPIFLIEKNKIKFDSKEVEVVKVIDKSIKQIKAANLPRRFAGAKETVLHIQKVIASVKNIDDYYLIPLGVTLNNKKSFSVFNAYFKEKLSEFLEGVSSPSLELEDSDETEFDLTILDNIFNKVIDIYRYIYIPRELSAEDFTKLHNKQFEFLMGKSLQQTLNETISAGTVKKINDSLDGVISELESDLESYIYKTNSDVRQTKLKRVDINNLIIEAYFNIRSMHLKVDDNSSMAITKLSSGEKQKAILDIANSLLRKNYDNHNEKYVIFGFDEPESSLHISACFDMFQSLYETTNYCSQVLFTTHLYGYIPSVIRGNTVVLNKGDDGVHKFDFINITKYREETRIIGVQSRHQLPFSIQLKSLNDLVQAIIYGSMSENPFNWLICEGSSAKVYFNYYLDDLVGNSRLRILPVGGYSEVKKLYNHLSIAFDDFKNEMKGKVFLVCDTDANLEANTDYVKEDSKHPKLKYRRLINNHENEKSELVPINSTTAANSTVLEDVLNAKTFIKVLKNMATENEELSSLLIDHNYVQLKEEEFYPSGLSIPEKRILKEFFGKNKNHMKVEFADKYVESIENIKEIIWINEIRTFYQK